ncbi:MULTISPECIES: energy transducer TonB family protein [Asaia]|uniref:Ferric siderophore transport system, periplasmic binding protein TonB n=1 Tax=Asaia bogorensis TaxID=91915 RepID=A0A060QJP1_9PROT|nr:MULTISPECIES: energy transducer TonB [Asaia]CDG41160.1 Ferric siderophore transport system, periplasmic binding protein TonB [Asaia bogorensis]
MTARRYRTAPATPAAASPAAGDMLSFRAVYQLHQKLEGQRQRRLGGCSALAILALTGLGIWAASTLRATPPLPYAPPPAAIAIDLAPEPASIPSPPQERPPGPPQVATPELPAPEKPPEIMAPPSPAPLPPVPVPAKIKVPPVRRKVTPTPPVPRHVAPLVPTQSTANTAPPPSDAPPSTVSATSAKGAPSTREMSQAKASWQGSLLARLERFKRYPAQAQAEHQEGTVMLRFTMDRKGHVLSASLVRPTGYAMLDDETLALVRRAEPLPAPPDTISGATLSLTVPVEFYMEEH